MTLEAGFPWDAPAPNEHGKQWIEIELDHPVNPWEHEGWQHHLGREPRPSGTAWRGGGEHHQGGLGAAAGGSTRTREAGGGRIGAGQPWPEQRRVDQAGLG